MKRALSLLALFLLNDAVGAAPALDDFAYAFELETQQPAGVYALPLPEAVYTRSLTPDLSDVAVFNAAGETVPHAVQNPPPEPATKPAPVELAYFPLYENKAEIPEQLTIKLLADFASASVELEKKPAPESGAVIAYIVDSGKRDRTLDPDIEALVIDWSNTGDSFITHIDIESSADLAHWVPIRRDAALARLSYAGRQLEQNRVELTERPDRFLRILWPAGRAGAGIDAVRAVFAQRPGAVERQWKTIAGHYNDDEANPAVEYESPGHLPIAEINLALGNVNSLLQGRIYSRDDPERPWHARGEQLFYRVQLADTEMTNPDIAVRPTTDRYWRVTYDPQQAGFGSEAPWLHVGWTPHRLVFLARGSGPYTLAYGSARARTRQAPVGQLLDELNKAMDTLPMGTAQAGRALHAGGADALMPPLSPLPWRNWLLWSSLIFGVLVLGFFAVRLYRQLNPTPR